MALRQWQTIKISHCQRTGTEVSFEAEVVYPGELQPDQPPRIVAHRCSHGLACNLNSAPSCVWSGTNPAYDPFED